MNEDDQIFLQRLAERLVKTIEVAEEAYEKAPAASSVRENLSWVLASLETLVAWVEPETGERPEPKKDKSLIQKMLP